VLAVLGLGNPGEEYRDTRHNAGLRVVESVAAGLGAALSRRRFSALVAEAQVGGEKLLLACPQTYMNASGRTARALADFFGLPPAGLLVVCDDFHLELGRLRVRRSGSAGGHKGLESVIRELGTEEFPRLRIGIGECRGDSTGFVLGRFSRSEEDALAPAIERAAEAVLVWAREGTEVCMNRFNAAETAEREGTEGRT
jgi:PTH1 family peptidyl-tRNA hydrolase